MTEYEMFLFKWTGEGPNREAVKSDLDSLLASVRAEERELIKDALRPDFPDAIRAIDLRLATSSPSPGERKGGGQDA